MSRLRLLAPTNPPTDITLHQSCITLSLPLLLLSLFFSILSRHISPPPKRVSNNGDHHSTHNHTHTCCAAFSKRRSAHAREIFLSMGSVFFHFRVPKTGDGKGGKSRHATTTSRRYPVPLCSAAKCHATVTFVFFRAVILLFFPFGAKKVHSSSTAILSCEESVPMSENVA